MKYKFLIYPISAILILGGFYYTEENAPNICYSDGSLSTSKCDNNTGGAETEDKFIAELKNNIDIEQIDWKATHTNYKMKGIEKKIPSGLETWTDEYDTPAEEGVKNPKRVKGYQIYFRKSDGSMMSTGTGILAESLSYDWTKSVATTSTSTQ